MHRFVDAVKNIIKDSDYETCAVSIALVDNPAIHAINRQYLDHDYPTDVLSFPLLRDAQRKRLEGEIIVSTDTAAENATEYGWSMQNEVLLYVIHGALHLIGYDDKNETGQKAMRGAESKYLKMYGIEHRYK